MRARTLSFVLIGLFVSLLFTANSAAYFIGAFTPTIDRSRETHVIVVGYSHGMGKLLIESSVATGLRLQEAFPERQVAFFVIRENEEVMSALEKFSVELLQENKKKLTPGALINELKTFTKIASLEFFSHTHVHWGAGIEGLKKSQRISHETPGLADLRTHFSPYGYVFFHGCNAGFVIAPALVKVLGVPVAGALASTSVERLHSDGNWYEDDWDQKFRRKGWANENNVSYAKAIPCERGVCTRMRPDNRPYQGTYGKFSVGLGFYKFFCPEEKMELCQVSMAQSLLGFPSQGRLQRTDSLGAFEKYAAKFLCASELTEKGREKCITGLASATAALPRDSFRGVEPECTPQKCNVAVKCSGKCRVTGKPNAERLLLYQEFEQYRSGWLRSQSRLFSRQID
jgi:hypothetical protein